MKQNALSLLTADTLAPEQFVQTCRRSAELEPEKALLLAVLEDAVGCLLKFHSARDRSGKRRFHEAEEWIMQSGSDWVFSFENVCELLELDPDYLRQGLRQHSAKMSRRANLKRYQDFAGMPHRRGART